MSKKVDLEKRIEAVLDEKVRAALHDHGGDVRITEIEGDILRIQLLGACSTCPSAYLTTESLIEEEVVKAVPEITKVVLSMGVSDDLYNQAKAILMRSKEGVNA